MKLLLLAVMLGGLLLPVRAQPAESKPVDLTLMLLWVADAGTPHQHVFTVNGSIAFRTVDGLKQYLELQPKGSTLTWSPGCNRIGNEPLLGSSEEMKKFSDFCKSIGIKFVLIPSG